MGQKDSHYKTMQWNRENDTFLYVRELKKNKTHIVIKKNNNGTRQQTGKTECQQRVTYNFQNYDEELLYICLTIAKPSMKK